MLRLAPLALLLAVTALSLSACSEEVVEADEIDAFYTLWGTFDPTAGQQAVRVIPITRVIGLGTADPLPVTVRSVDLATDAETVWRDSVITFRNGSVGHVYLADFQPAYGSRHLFRVIDADGTDTSALVAVPPLVEPIRQQPVLGVGVDYPVLFPGAPRLNRVRATYLLESRACVRYEVTLPLDFGSARPAEFGTQVVLKLRDYSEALLFAEGNERQPVALVRVTLQTEVASEDWRPPGGLFDPEVLIEPGTLTNVANGFGFVGSAYPLSISWEPTPDELARSAFRQPGFGCGASG